MGICDTNIKPVAQNKIISEPKIKEEPSISTYGKITTENELINLYSYKSAICKIEFKTKKNGKIVNGLGTGFFCEINDDNIPFKKALFTNNHILDEKSIEINKEIEFEYLKQKNIITITKNRKTFTSKKFDYTCIEIFDTDKINNFFKIDNTIFDNKNSLINKEIFILQYANGGDLSNSLGKITAVENKIIKHSAATEEGSSGSPLIKRYNDIVVIGMHVGVEKNIKNEVIINVATPFDIIIKDITNKLFNKNNGSKSIKYRNIINLIYEKNKKKYNHDYNNIFGSKFVENNKENIKLVINGEKSELIEKYNLKIGINNIQLIIINTLTNLECMFYNCKSLKNIEELKYLNTEEVNNFSYMFWDCSSLSDIKALENWNVSNGNDFSYMFWDCSSLRDIEALENWNVSNGINFSGMFWDCSSLINIEALRNWNVSNGKNFSYMFSGCSSLLNIKALHNWNISNKKYFSYMFI